ncbi:hypothetical protein ACFQ1M_14360 [Sungkyunkwania multivorans]|uniref:Bulb-type lectin domain-containing protein n=1 Tax=Sungkyunkwania multivorans TaxID=1173618 RepID=A0ABW3D1D3_9FLAO
MKNYTLYSFLFLISAACLLSCSSDSSDDTPTSAVFIGELDWAKTIGGTREDVAEDVLITSDSGIAIFGTTKSIDGDIIDHQSEDNDFWLAKFSADGSLLWNKTYGGSSEDSGKAVIQTSDGGFAAVGFSRSTDGDVAGNNGFYDKWVIKVDASGELQWQKNFGFTGLDQAFSIVQTTDGGYFVGGFLDVTASGGLGNEGTATRNLHGVGDFWIHKLDANGNLIWRNYFGGSNNDRCYDIIQTDDGGVIMMGSSESNDVQVSNSKGSYDFWIVKVSSAGQIQWERSYGGSDADNGFAIAKSSDGGYLLVGDTQSTDGDVTDTKGSFDFWAVKINATGNIQWQKTYGGTGFESATDVVALQDGGYAIAGSSRSSDGDVSGNYAETDFWVIKISDSGTLLWEKNFGGSNFDFAHGIVETDDKKLIVVGDTYSTDNDVTLNKGQQDLLVIQIK